MDVFQLGFADVFAVFGLVIHELPEEHPDESQAADDDEGPLPAESLGKRRDGQRSGESAHGGTCIEDGRRECAVFLGEIFGRSLDGRREVARLAKGQDAAAEQEQVDRRRGYRKGYIGTGLNGPQGRYGIDSGHNGGGGPAACGMHDGTGRPYADGDEVALLGAHPVDEFSGEEARDGVKN